VGIINQRRDKFVITTSELHSKAAAEGIRFDQVEKDYVILWILNGLSNQEFGPMGWVFKGGTCLRHCYYAGYRFSEDLDFSCHPMGKDLEKAQDLLMKVASWIQKKSGIVMTLKTALSIPGELQAEIPIQYSRGGLRRTGLPLVKIHLTFDEPIVTQTVIRQVMPAYSDMSVFEVIAYSKEEIIGEKMRALLQQQKKWPRPRDLYDLWFILCQSGERFQGPNLKEVFIQKCQTRNINPDMASLVSENLREWNKDAWRTMLGSLLRDVPEFDKVWQEWVVAFQEIFG